MSTYDYSKLLKLAADLRQLNLRELDLVIDNTPNASHQVKVGDTLEEKIKNLREWAEEDVTLRLEAIRNAIIQVKNADPRYSAPALNSQQSILKGRRLPLAFFTTACVLLVLAGVYTQDKLIKKTVALVDVVPPPDAPPIPDEKNRNPPASAKTIPNDESYQLLSRTISDAYRADGSVVGSFLGSSPTFTGSSDMIATPDYEESLSDLTRLAIRSTNPSVQKAARLAVQLHVLCRTYRSRVNSDTTDILDQYIRVFRDQLNRSDFDQEFVKSSYLPMVSLNGKTTIEQNEIQRLNIINITNEIKESLRAVARQQSGKNKNTTDYILTSARVTGTLNHLVAELIMINSKISLSNCTIIVRPSFKPLTSEESRKNIILGSGIRILPWVLIPKEAGAVANEFEKIKPALQSPEASYPSLQNPREFSYYVANWPTGGKISVDIDSIVNFRDQLINQVEITVYSSECTLVMDVQSAVNAEIAKVSDNFWNAISPGKKYDGNWAHINNMNNTGQIRVDFLMADQAGKKQAKITEIRPLNGSLNYDVNITYNGLFQFTHRLTLAGKARNIEFRLNDDRLEGKSSDNYIYTLTPVK